MLSKAQIKDMGTIYGWYKDIYENEYAELLRIFKLPDDDTIWDRYEQMHVTGLPEQKLFRKAAAQLKKKYLSQYILHESEQRNETIL